MLINAAGRIPDLLYTVLLVGSLESPPIPVAALGLRVRIPQGGMDAPKYLITVFCMEDKKEGLGNSSELRECFSWSCGRNWRLTVKGRFPSTLLLLWIMTLVTHQIIEFKAHYQWKTFSGLSRKCHSNSKNNINELYCQSNITKATDIIHGAWDGGTLQCMKNVITYKEGHHWNGPASWI